MTTQPTYVMDRSDSETDRLRVQSQLFEAATVAALEDAGVATGMRCLDAGCGGGDVMRLLGERVGAKGSVTGLDVDAALGERVLARLDDARYRFLHGDLLRAPLPAGGYDVVTARFLLIHLGDPAAGLARLWEATAPGGTLAIVDFDFRTLAGQPSRTMTMLATLAADVFGHAGLDWQFAATLPSVFAAAGLGRPDRTRVSGLLWPLDEIAPFLRSTFANMLPGAHAAGIDGQARLAAFERALDRELHEDPSSYLLGPLVVSACKRKPL